jgi:meiosis-specific transcription factor NDT80
MDQSYGSKSPQTNHPPLGQVTTLGNLQTADGGTCTPVKIDISATIDKGFFKADGEWTCYRRNYFSCVCSFSLATPYPGMSLQYTPQASSQTYQVIGFAMCISAVVADNDGHTIELVQHTPKRDKGPTQKPEKVRLSPKQHQPHHGLMYGGGHDGSMSAPSRTMYGNDFAGVPPNQAAYQAEHTFERIQFKQATANNGKRRAAQQYYHLLVELYIDVGTQHPDQFIKIAYRKSAKMIVRGRSPGHYQGERRGSTSSGPGGSGASLGGSYQSSQYMGMDSQSGTGMLSGGGYSAYDTRSSGGYGARHHASHLPTESMISAEDAKAIDTVKAYQYFPGSIYEDQQDTTRVDMFTHRPEHETVGNPMTAPYDPLKVKPEPDAGHHAMLPSLFHNGPLMNPRCRPFEAKSSSAGHYPTMMPQS